MNTVTVAFIQNGVRITLESYYERNTVIDLNNVAPEVLPSDTADHPFGLSEARHFSETLV